MNPTEKKILNKIQYNNKKMRKELDNIKDYMDDSYACIISEAKQKQINDINFEQMEYKNKKIYWIIIIRTILTIILIAFSYLGVKISMPMIDNLIHIFSVTFGI